MKALHKGPAIKASSHYLYFIFAGSCGFIVDAGVVTILKTIWQFDLVIAKAISFLLAVTVTWWINRTHTFKVSKDKNLVKEWIHYFSANSIGAIINNSLYVGLIFTVPITKEYPALAVAVGSLGGMVFNYLASKKWVFKQ
ncbi:MAG: GtrA family protein [Betaproteobacteria bacterium]|nr:GtrA family protein [Betaproteobacteria bacterium]MDE2422593.1 GtrA family protein [Betaproteobacteria bacterium]